MAGLSDDEQAAAAAALDAEGDSGSDFGIEQDAASANGADPEEEDELMDDVDSEKQDTEEDESYMLDVIPVKAAKGGRSRKPKPGADSVKALPTRPPGLARPSTRQMYVLPAPNIHHRHRAVSLYSHSRRVERLTTPPLSFGPQKTAPTHNFTHSPPVTDRVNKAWGYNVGSGPLWELLEDRGWYKESALSTEPLSTPQIEAAARPVVHKAIKVLNGWQVLSLDDAIPYLPSDSVMTEDGQLKSPPAVPCSFGPFGDQTRVEVSMFETHKMSKFIPESRSHVINAGAPVWGLDWCPIHPDQRKVRDYRKYLAVAPFPTRSHAPLVGARVLRPAFACIQIWSLKRSSNPAVPGESSSAEQAPPAILDPNDDVGEMKCEMILCIESGPAHELKWCPLPSHDDARPSDSANPRKLGLLAGIFEDGSMSIFVVPDPADIRVDHTSTEPVYVKLPEPILRIELGQANCWTMDWANSEVLAIGTTHGTIAVYDIAKALAERNNTSTTSATSSPILPTHYMPIHQSGVRALSWIRVPPSFASGEPRLDGNPTVIASGGYDGLECLTDIREGHGSAMNRTRDVITTVSYSPFAGGPITIDHENIIKSFSASPSMLGRGHMILEPAGPVWNVHASDYHPQLAVASADGTVTTTNTLRSTRRGGSVPFFVHKIYQMDFSRNTGEYRMLERFLPQETQDKVTATKNAKSKTKAKDPLKVTTLSGTGAWSSEVGVHRVVWHNGDGLSGAGLLASATASGLCRIDWLAGRWLNDKIPYLDIARIRMERKDGAKEEEEAGMDIDGEGEPDNSDME